MAEAVRWHDLRELEIEGTVDSSHPTDLGFMRQAQAFLPLLQELLGG